MGDDWFTDILQLLKEKSEKMKKLGLAIKVIQDGMRQNTPIAVKTGVGEEPRFGTAFSALINV